MTEVNVICNSFYYEMVGGKRVPRCKFKNCPFVNDPTIKCGMYEQYENKR